MKHPSALLAYRQASVQQASPVGLVIMLYDALVTDLHQAIAAMNSGDIEARCRCLKHGFLILQQLDGLLNMEQGGMTAQNLRRFYGHIRSAMLAAQFQRAPTLLERQITYLLDVRSAWEQVDAPRGSTAPDTMTAELYGSQQAHASSRTASAVGERPSFSCSV